MSMKYHIKFMIRLEQNIDTKSHKSQKTVMLLLLFNYLKEYVYTREKFTAVSPQSMVL